KKQFGDRFGGLLTFRLSDKDACFRFMDALKIIRRSTNLNDNKTLIMHPASTIFCEYSEEERKKMRIPENMLRLSVGIEDVEDIFDDLSRGLKAI
ncbi:MAG: O-acetylhomoserine aminocarboxypropyltransferase/cysteine synthase, partial [Calditrichaeota bacterium]|nr:O-acetylhomoserine aminocarboxypropyltransferase/cysteine synthase [Calditrichota bacterium]